MSHSCGDAMCRQRECRELSASVGAESGQITPRRILMKCFY